MKKNGAFLPGLDGDTPSPSCNKREPSFQTVMVLSDQQEAYMPNSDEKSSRQRPIEGRGTVCSTKPWSRKSSIPNPSECIAVKLCHANVSSPEDAKIIHELVGKVNCPTFSSLLFKAGWPFSSPNCIKTRASHESEVEIKT